MVGDEFYLPVRCCPICGGTRDCGTGHVDPYTNASYATTASGGSQVVFYSRAASSWNPKSTPTKHVFRAGGLGRRYIPAALEIAAFPRDEIEIDAPWRALRAPVRTLQSSRRASYRREISPLRARPGRRRRRRVQVSA